MTFDTIALVRRLRQGAPALIAAILLVGCQSVGQEPVEFTYSGTMTYDVTQASITTQPVRDLAALDQAVVSGAITVFVEPHRRIYEVAFYLDDPDQTREPVLTDASVPYELVLDTTALMDGEHTLTAVSRVQRGKSQTLETATFVTTNHE